MAITSGATSVISKCGEVIDSIETLRVVHNPMVEQGRDGEFVSVESSHLHPEVRQLLFDKYESGLFTHQHHAIEALLQGEDAVVSTRTSSGKSLIYSLPIFDSLCREPTSCSLLLFPQKALAGDQLLKLKEMGNDIPSIRTQLKSKTFFISRYDGSTPSDDRAEVREQCQVLLTNPDMLHFAIMQHHDRLWSRFFRNLKLIAIDECHEYRGVFGTNVAYILRRLRQICRSHGSNPQFVATSATVHDPNAHMRDLTGKTFSLIGEELDGSLQGNRKFWIVDSTEHYYDAGRKLAMELAKQGLTVLAFCQNRVAAERMVGKLGKKNEFARVYRAGLSVEQRAEIEQGLRDGTVRLVFSTSALELGIDIGSIDVVVGIGLPHTMMSLWQRAGRTARGGREGAIIFVPADTPIDTYYKNHPHELFARDHEPLVLNMDNERIVCQHFACATYEMGTDEESLETSELGPQLTRVKELRVEGKLNRPEFYRDDPHMEINIRGGGSSSYSLMLGDEQLGEIDSFHLLRESHRNAIYRHGGQAYRVRDVHQGRKVVRLKREYSPNETTPYIQKKIKLQHQTAVAEYTDLQIANVIIEVSEQLVSVTEKDPTGKVVNSWPGSQGHVPHVLPTAGTALFIRRSLWDDLERELGTQVLKNALQGCERLIASLFPTVAGPCDSQDYSSAVNETRNGEWAIYLYDLVYEGIDLTRVAFDRMADLLEKSLERVRSCSCQTDTGCIRCIKNPVVDADASKHATIALLGRLLDTMCSESPKIWVDPTSPGDRIRELDEVCCPACDQQLAASAKFCSNCGERLVGEQA